MKLYYAPGACSMASHIVLNELGFQFQAESVNLKDHKTASGADFYQINPKGYIPALVLDNGKILTEGVAILLYLTESKKAFASVEDRVSFVEMLVFIATEIHKPFGALFSLKENETQAIAAAKEKVGKRLEYMDKHLVKHPYLLGDHFTAADAYFFTVVNWSNFLKLDLSPWKNVQAYQQRVLVRESVQKALKAEGLLK